MAHDSLQLDWNPTAIRAQWPQGADNAFILRRMSEVVIELTGEERHDWVLDVGSAEAEQSRALRDRGLSPFILDPSVEMLERARTEMARTGAVAPLIRGVSETLPFRDASFDRVLCHSAIDHFAEPERCIEEMARVCKRSGRVVVTAVNYGGLTVRLSRMLYGIGRAFGRLPPDTGLFWDTPVPKEHTFECSYGLMQRLCAPHLELDRCYGVSIGWMMPGWGALLERLPPAARTRMLEALDQIARRAPAIADFVVSIWQPKNRGTLGPQRAPDRARSTSVVYPYAIKEEAKHWGMATYTRERDWGDEELANLAFTRDPQLSWRDDLMRRGPFKTAAVLGCDEARHDLAWLRSGATEQLDVYELSPAVIGKVRAAFDALGARSLLSRVNFIQADLNTATLPADRYDVIWSSGTLHCILELEHLLDQVEHALRPEGLFAFREYTGESRRRYDPYRLEYVCRALAEIPARFFVGDPASLKPPAAKTLSPFCSVRSAEILPLVRERLDEVHFGPAGALFPLSLCLDFEAMRREDPETLRTYLRFEREALADPLINACAVYAVFRRRA